MIFLRLFSFSSLPAFILLFAISNSAFAGIGKVRMSADQAGVSIYVGGDKKGIIGEGFADIYLEEGVYIIEARKEGAHGEWIYKAANKVFVATGGSIRMWFELKRYSTKKRKQKLAAEEVRLQRAVKDKQKVAIEEAKMMVASERKDKIDARYVDNKNGTITDKITGLMWKQCAEGLSGKKCEQGRADEFQWDDIMDYADGVDSAGHTNWQVPSIAQLQTLVYCSNNKQRKFKPNGWQSIKDYERWGCGISSYNDYEKPTIKKNLFPNTPANSFWSSTIYDKDEEFAWSLNFYEGYDSKDFGRHNAYRLRLVRKK